MTTSDWEMTSWTDRMKTRYRITMSHWAAPARNIHRQTDIQTDRDRQIWDRQTDRRGGGADGHWVIFGLRTSDYITGSLIQLHWLPIHWQIQYKLCLMMHSIYRNSDRSPAYLADMVKPASTRSTRRLRSRESGRTTPSYEIWWESVLIFWSVRVERSPHRWHRHPRRNLHRRFQEETENFLLFSGVWLHMISFYFISLVTICNAPAFF